MTASMRLLAACLLASTAALAEPVCPRQSLARVSFPAGERLEFRLDAFGADVGTFDLTFERGNNGAAWTMKSRARTSAFISTNVKQYEAYVAVSTTRDFLPLHYREDVDEGVAHKSAETDFPAKADTLAVRVTTAGKAEDLQLAAGPETRELLTSLFFLRAQPLRQGQPICAEVYAGRKMWKVTGSVAARETIDTPLGRFPTVRIDATAVRIDDANARRAAHLWLTDDDRRLPVVAIGEVRGRTLRAQLTDASSLPRKRAQAAETRRNAIGR